MSKSEWRRVRVVVEVPVRGEYSEKDLRWDVERVIGGLYGPLMSSARRNKKAVFGTASVKSMNKVIDATIRERARAAADRVVRLERRVDEIEFGMSVNKLRGYPGGD